MKPNQHLKDTLKNGESAFVEFKSSFDREAIETLSAFANTKGGTIFIGVNNQGEIAGCTIGSETLQQWANQVKLATTPSILPEIESLQINDQTVVAVSVNEYPVKPVCCKGNYFKRIHSSNHKLDITEISNLHLQTFNTSWDHYEDCRHELKDISLEKVNNFIEMTNKIRPYSITDSPMVVLKKFELLVGEKISNGCFLLFTAEDCLSSTIDIGRFASETIIKDSVTIRADLFNEVEMTVEFICKHMNRSYVITGSPQRQEKWDYPLDALREIVINMIVHRDYMDGNSSIIKIFDDHIEFFNPGVLPGDLTVKKLLTGRYSSQARNKQIAMLFKEAGIIERYGSGIKRILEFCNDYGLPQPKFENIQHGFRVTLFQTTQKTTQKTSTEQQVLEILRNNPELTRKEIAAHLGKSPNTIKGHIAILKKKGVLQRIGSDRRGSWKVL